MTKTEIEDLAISLAKAGALRVELRKDGIYHLVVEFGKLRSEFAAVEMPAKQARPFTPGLPLPTEDEMKAAYESVYDKAAQEIQPSKPPRYDDIDLALHPPQDILNPPPD